MPALEKPSFIKCNLNICTLSCGCLGVICRLLDFVWNSKCTYFFQAEEIQELKECKDAGEKTDLAGDGKFDSPGWGAKFCTYVLQSLKNRKIVGIWVANKSMISI